MSACTNAPSRPIPPSRLQEFARCRRLNTVLSTALGTRACDALDRAGYNAGLGSDPGFTAGLVVGRAAESPGFSGKNLAGGENASYSSPGGDHGRRGSHSSDGAPSSRSAQNASGLFRWVPLPTRAFSRYRSPSPPPPDRPRRLVQAGEGRGEGGGGKSAAVVAADETALTALSAADVKRGLRFCMKVHRFRETCRVGSCVAVWKVSIVFVAMMAVLIL